MFSTHRACILYEETYAVTRNDSGEQMKSKVNCEEEYTCWATNAQETLVSSSICQISARATSNDKEVTINAEGSKFPQQSCIVNKEVVNVVGVVKGSSSF